MRELLRRIAVLSVLSAAGIALLAPVATRSASGAEGQTERLVAAAHAPATAGLTTTTTDLSLRRAAVPGRERSAALTLAEVGRPAHAAELLTGPTPRPTPGSVSIMASFSSATTPKPTPSTTSPPATPPLMRGDTVSGKATYYCCTLGYRGQAVIALPGALGGQYDAPPAARYVTVCADRCASLPVVDRCGCYWGTASQKVADLSPEAWAAITDRSRSLGVVSVTIHLG